MTTFADPSTFPSVLDVPAEADTKTIENDTNTIENGPTETAEAAVETAAETAVASDAAAGEATDETAVASDAAAGEATDETAEADVEITDPTTENTEITAPEVSEAPRSFGELGLPRDLVRALGREGITTPFDIQSATIPDAVAGRDVLGRGQTGSGKTLAFGLPVLARVALGGRAEPHRPKALILVPTRELAMQVNDALVPLGKSLGVFLKTAVGGVPYDRQIDALRRGVEVMVATPGRLKDLIERGACALDRIEVTVLDEADQMADMGFLPEVTELLSKTPADAQRLLFSATLDGDVDALVRRFMTDPVTHSTAPAEASVTTMDHHMLLIPPHDKFAVTASIAAREGKTMVFARTQLGVDRLVEQLAAVGVRAGALHGGKTQRVRTRTLAQFKDGHTNVLVATDVAARGIHVDGVSLVVHVDPPKDPKDYLHRAGRTARAGESGAVATLVLPKQRRTTLAMMQKAGVEPAQLRVKAGDPSLGEVTGAREPSGVPVKPEPEERGRRDDRPRGRFGDRPRGDRSYGDRPQGERRSYGDRPQGDRPSYGRPQGERTYGDRPQGDRPSYGRPQGERTYGDRPQGERRSYGDRPQGDRPNYADRPQGDRPSYGRPQGERTYGDRPQGERSYSDRPRTEHARAWSDRPSGDRTYGDRPARTERTDRPFGGERRFGDRPRTSPAPTH